MKGKIGVAMNVTGRARSDRIACDCSKCSNRRSRGKIVYCQYYDIFDPNRKSCARYDGPKVHEKGQKSARANGNKRRLPAEEMAALLDEFCANVEPWCRENSLSLHQAFEISRATEPSKYRTLSRLWGTQAGKAFLRSAFRGGKLKKEKGNE